MASNLYPLKPLTLGRILDRTVRIYRSQFLTFLALAATVQIPLLILQLLFFRYYFDFLGVIVDNPLDPLASASLTNQTAINLSSYGLRFLQMVFVPFSTAAIALGTVKIMFGETISFGKLIRAALARWQSILGTAALTLFFTIGIFIATLIICVVGWLTGPGVSIYFSAVIIPFIPIVLILEDAPAFDVFARVWNLARQRFWWTLGTAMVLGTFGFALTFGIRSLAMLGGFIALGKTFTELVDPSFSQISGGFVAYLAVEMVLSLLVVPLVAIGRVLIYLDLRVRYEGLDIALKLDHLKALGSSAQANIAAAPRLSMAWKPTSKEWGYFFSFVLAIIALYALLIGFIFLIVFITGYASGAL